MSRPALRKTLVLACLALSAACAQAVSHKAIVDRDGGRDAQASFSDLARAPERAAGPSLDSGRSFAEQKVADGVVPGWMKNEDAHGFDNKEARTLPHHRHVEEASAEVPAVTAPIPEPSTYAMIAAGLVGIGFIVRRRSQQSR